MSDGSGPESRHDAFLATVRQLASGITEQHLLFSLALAVVVALLAGLFIPRLNAPDVLLFGLVTLLGVLSFGLVALLYRRSQPSEPNHKTSSAASVPELVIGYDGGFVGGDQVASGIVLDALDMPRADRTVHVRATPLEDEAYRLEHPDQFVRLRTAVRSYELSLGRLLRGSVHFYWKFEVSELAEAVLELRRVELPGLLDRKWWFVWPPANPSRVVHVALDEANSKSIQSGGYSAHQNTGMPSDEPIWLAAIFPSIVWTRAVPAVVAHQRMEYPGPKDPPILDITRWVLSDRQPAELTHTHPSQNLHVNESTWNW